MQNKLQIYLTAPDKNVLSQCVIIKTPNNKIVVVDGGHLEFEPCLAPAIRGILGLKDDEYFEIEAWFISHAHGDHYGELVKMFNGAEKNTNFKVNNIYFDFPVFENTNLHDFEPKFLQTYKDALDSYAKMHGIDCNGSCYDYLNGKVINRESVEKGLTITIDGIPFDILQTHADVDEQVNANSTVIRIRFESQDGLKKVLILNDVSELSGDRLVEKYGDELKSDIVQLSHHGQMGAKKSTYDVIDAKIRLWPTPYWVWTQPDRFKIGEVRDWFNLSENGGSPCDLVACLYDEYPEDRTKAEDWAKCVHKMMVEI